ncbi:MAG: rhomboid family intramembrane serine protease [Gammaproteobacteria bacterium]|nr:rhomboid family intramembrane serine protease [Gammaproteobacteria bacterium]MDH5303982.1 rhomboid family intramembrane serine protease [Gammaproteobacteria bacterium]MDH5321743.1 rhomboid family intramembrane serine protease [Gammaproteobacteria bacterium]
MSDDLRVVFQSNHRADCADRALVLAAAQIPFQSVTDTISCALLVPAEFSARAMHELTQYDNENPPLVEQKPPAIVYQNAIPGLLGYALLICGIAAIVSSAPLAQDWYVAGRVDGALIRAGEWWRTVTALTLHSGLQHLLGNLGFGLFFGLFAGRLLGSGVAWLAIVVAAASGNVLNTLLLESTHRAVGASTAVFAALGLIAGYVWRGKLMRQDRWPYRVGPIVGGFALLMYTGTGTETTDVGAHLMGFLCGLGGGILLAAARNRLLSFRLQIACGLTAIVLVAAAWIAALHS